MKSIYFKKLIFVLLLPFFLHASERKTVCLNMIVKNERSVIVKCLESIKPHIDFWVIVDTGSTDGTQDVIRSYMRDIPGQLHERPWVSFEHNRNEALELARGMADYCLFIDADEIFVCPQSFKMPDLVQDMYAINIHLTKNDGTQTSSPRLFMIKKELKGRWQGVLHETFQCEPLATGGMIENVYIQTDMQSGHRSQDPQKYFKDAQTLKKALEADPQNHRYQFYLGVSYELAGELQLALEAFQRRVEMQGDDPEEMFRSLFQIGVLQERLHKPSLFFLASYQKAFQFCPSRAEPLFFMGTYYASISNYTKAYELFKQATQIPYPNNSSFIEAAVYHWASHYNLAICAEELCRKEEACQLFEMLIQSPELPANLLPIARTKLQHLRQSMVKVEGKLLKVDP